MKKKVTSTVASSAEPIAFGEVLHLIQSARQRAYQAVNVELVTLYWQVGETISRKIVSDGWGKGTIESLSSFVQHAQPGIRGFSPQNLWRMRQFYETYREQPILSALLRELPWTHHMIIMGQSKMDEEREFYILLTIREKWSNRELERQFRAGLFARPFADWERLSIFLNFLVPKLPAPIEEDLAKGILETIDMDSYRVEKKASLKVLLPDDNAEIGPVPTTGGGRMPEPELDRLSNILKTLNDQFGTLFTDNDRIARRITEDIVPKVALDEPYQNAKKNTPSSARIELDAALMRAAGTLLKDDTEFYKQFVQNESFKQLVTDTVVNFTAR